jgi:hypothetical protein
MSFTQKIISVTITLAQGSFAGTSGQNQVTLDGYRMSAQIVKAGGASQGYLQLRIYGLDLALMNQLSTLGRTPVIIDGRNKISISAGDSETGIAVVFVGTIYEAYTDLSNPPDAIFHVAAFAGLGEAMQTVASASYGAAADAANIMSSLATQAGLTFENNGVSVMLHSPYFPGSLRKQMQDCAEAANIDWIIDDGKLAIWPKIGNRGGAVPLISPDTGLIGYPFPSGQGRIGVKCLFNPQISFGAQFRVQSSITPANGTWTACHVTHDIESQMPNGQWMTVLQGLPPGYLGTS